MLKLAFSRGSEGIQGSPYIKLGPNSYLIFSTITMTPTGFKYLIYTNGQLEEGDRNQQENGSFFTNMIFKGTEDGPSMGISADFKRNPHYPAALAVRDLIAPYLNEKNEFPPTAMPALADDIIRYNNDDPEILKRVKGIEKEKRTRKVKTLLVKAKKEKVEKKPKKEKKAGKKVKAKKPVKKAKKVVKKVKKVVKKATKKPVKKATKKPVKKAKKVTKKVKVVKTKKPVKKVKKAVKKTKTPMRKAAKGRKSTKRGKRKEWKSVRRVIRCISGRKKDSSQVTPVSL